MDGTNLDRTLVSTWKSYSDTLKHYLTQGQIAKAIQFIEKVDHTDLPDNASDFIVFKALAYVMNGDLGQGLGSIQIAHLYGFKRFWKFDGRGKAWVDPADPEFILLSPIHRNVKIQTWINRHYSSEVTPWGFDVSHTPFCSLRLISLRHDNVRCYISKKKLRKEDHVYEFRFFNGSHDIPMKPFYSSIDVVNNDELARENVEKYKTNSYCLKQYAFKTGYNHPLINYFWNNLEQFDLDETLKIIANPPVHSTPYLSQALDTPLSAEQHLHANWHNQTDRQIYYGTGGIFINLLYTLIKCGYQQEILKRLDVLPKHFGLLLMCFNDVNLRQSVAEHLGYSKLPTLYEHALLPHTKKTPELVKQLADFGSQNPEFRKQLAFSLDTYEYHLYSNYRPGVNWFFEPFHCFKNARGGGLLDFLISEPEQLPVLREMKDKLFFPLGISNGVVDAFDNSFPFLFRTLMFNTFLKRDKSFEHWQSIPKCLDNSPNYKHFKSVYNASIKTIHAWKSNAV